MRIRLLLNNFECRPRAELFTCWSQKVKSRYLNLCKILAHKEGYVPKSLYKRIKDFTANSSLSVLDYQPCPRINGILLSPVH